MYKDAKPIEILRNSGAKILLIGVGGLGFHIGEILIRDKYDLGQLYFVDNDIADDKTLYKYGYSPDVKVNTPKVMLLKSMARRRFLMESTDEKDKKMAAFDTAYTTHFMPIRFAAGMKIDELINDPDLDDPLIIINCVDNSSATDSIYTAYEEYKAERQSNNNPVYYFNLAFDGNQISGTTEQTWGSYSGYSIGSSNYLSEKAALAGLEYIASVLKAKMDGTEPNKYFNMNLADFDKVMDMMSKYAIAGPMRQEFYDILVRRYKEAINEHIKKDAELLKLQDEKKRRKFTYVAEGNPIYTNINKKLSNNIYLKGYHVGSKDNKDRRKEILSYFAEIPTFKYKKGTVDVVLPLIDDPSMISLFPPLNIPGIPDDYIKGLYMDAFAESMDIASPYLYDYLDFIIRDSIDLNAYKVNFVAKNIADAYGVEKNSEMDKDKLHILSILGADVSRFILLLGYIRMSSMDEYKVILDNMYNNGILKNTNYYDDGLFERPFMYNSPIEYAKNHNKSSGFKITTEINTLLHHNHSYRVSTYGETLATVPYITTTITMNSGNLRYLELGGAEIRLNSGIRSITIPDPKVLESELVSYFYSNKFASVAAESIYNLADIASVVRHTINLVLEEAKYGKKE